MDIDKLLQEAGGSINDALESSRNKDLAGTFYLSSCAVVNMLMAVVIELRNVKQEL
jgi:hypothetical protein